MIKTLIIISLVFYSLSAPASEIQTGNILHISDNTTIAPDSVIDADKIIVDGSATIVNHGTISGDIFVGSGTELRIQNSGTVTGTIYTTPQTVLTQIITSADEMTNLDVWGSYNVLVSGNTELDLADIRRVAIFADEIILDNATISISNTSNTITLLRRRMPELMLVGEVTINIDPAAVSNGDIILSGVSGDGAVFVNMPGLNDLFIATTRRQDSNIYLNIIRETDYVKILDPVRGMFMNILRDIDSDDKFVRAMDTATSRPELEYLMTRSVRFNPMNLMRPVNIINAFELADPDVTDGFDLRYDMIVDSQMHIPKLHTGLGAKFGPMSIGISGYAALTDYTDDLNEYSATMFGGDIRAGLDFKYVWGRGVFGMSVAQFDVGPVLGADNIYFDPRGRSRYGVIDAGIRMKSGNFYAAPFVGFGLRDNFVAGVHDRINSPRGGTSIGYSHDNDGLRYDYQLHTTVTRDTIVAGMAMEIYSDWDGVGGEFAADILCDETGTDFKLSVRGTCAF